MVNLKSTQQLKAFLGGTLCQVDIKAIQSELNALWLKASTGSPDDEEHPQVVRACSANLILYTDRDDAERVDSDLLDDVLQQHPARAILAICRPVAEFNKIEAWVSARCHITGNGRQVCSEMITVLSEGNAGQELISVIDSLLIGDLPIFVWWTIDDLNGEKIAPFLANAKRLIVDSARAPYSFSFLRDLQRLVDSTLDCIHVSDLNWRRLLGIRSAIAEEFDRLPLNISDLQKIKKVKLASCGQELNADDCSIQSLLLLGWLASRLDWEPVCFGRDGEGKPTVAKYSNGVEATFGTTSLNHVAQGSVFEVELELEDGKKLRISRDPAGEAGSLVVSLKDKDKVVRELLADDSDLSRVNLVGFELEELTADCIFAQSLSSAIDLIELLEAK
ncbi:MAG: glucose-6-phosphate dehydrogenase assembly protein OpcA [Candidatus Obscuribacterales bacterium]|nr:glucose-6-phosphate dehydrogenase assembly protein OpcA [Candidatus Obscuribacterales bacterium]